jgi:hypothetical protein
MKKALDRMQQSVSEGEANGYPRKTMVVELRSTVEAVGAPAHAHCE